MSHWKKLNFIFHFIFHKSSGGRKSLLWHLSGKQNKVKREMDENERDKCVQKANYSASFDMMLLQCVFLQKPFA